jgi:DNA-binding GntR family transcriptional regulator
VTSPPHLLPLIRNGERLTVEMPRLPAGATAFTVVSGIRKAIMLGNLRRGDQFCDEDGLATSFGVSRRLVHRGLLILVDSGQATRQGSTGWALVEG